MSAALWQPNKEPSPSQSKACTGNLTGCLLFRQGLPTFLERGIFTYTLPEGRCRGGTMIALHENYVVDEHGNRKAVVVPMGEWQKILEALEELDDIRAYDEAKRYPSDTVPFEQAVLEIGEGNAE